MMSFFTVILRCGSARHKIGHLGQSVRLNEPGVPRLSASLVMNHPGNRLDVSNANMFVGTTTTHGNDCNIRSTMIPPARTDDDAGRWAIWLIVGLPAALTSAVR